MKTFLPQNQFGALVPEASDEAGASTPAPLCGASATLSVAQPSGVMETEAATLEETAASDISDVPEIFRVANLLCETRQFVPDYPGIYQAMLDPNAPRALETDPVWSDDAPIFLKSIG